MGLTPCKVYWQNMNLGFTWFASAFLNNNIKYWKHNVHPQIATISDSLFSFFFHYRCGGNASLLLCVLSAETDSFTNTGRQPRQHQQHYNLFPSLDQRRHTRRGGAKQGKQFRIHAHPLHLSPFPFKHTPFDWTVTGDQRHFSSPSKSNTGYFFLSPTTDS